MSRCSRCWLMLSFALTVFSAWVDASAYTLTGGKWPQPGGLGAPITISYSYQNMFEDQNQLGQGLFMPNNQRLPDLLIRNSIEEALGTWAAWAPLNFVEVPDDGKTYAQGSTEYGEIRFRHTFINGPDPPPPAPPIAKAQAYFPYGGVFSGDVEYDNADRWQEIGTLPVPDILGATVHELGHSLGLNHTNLEEANMYWIFNRFSGLGTAELFADDIAGIRAIYGAGQGSVTPLVGAWQDRPILPSSQSDHTHHFTNVPSGMWFDPPLVSSFEFTAESGTLFTEIIEFPTGFDAPFMLTVNGTTLGEFEAGESYSFDEFPNSGVSQFKISGISPLVDAGNPLGFPLRLGFSTPTGSFSITAVPEPATLAMLALAGLSLMAVRRRHVRL